MDGELRTRLQVHRQHDALGTWTVAFCAPPPALRGIVASLWYGAGAVAYQRDRILPSGNSLLLINLGPTQYRIENRGQNRLFPEAPDAPDGRGEKSTLTPVFERRVAFEDVWYSGLHQGPIDTEAPHGNALFGVAFTAAGARPWLGVDAGELADRITPLADLLGAPALQLRQRLLETPSLEARFALVEAWLLARLSPRLAPNPLLAWALARIEARSGQVAVDTLAREAGVSRKHLAALFRTQVGLGAKSLAQVHRFRAATRLLAGRERVPWADLAALCGYYDQSHLVRDFRRFSGLAPGEFVRHAMADGNSLVIR